MKYFHDYSKKKSVVLALLIGMVSTGQAASAQSVNNVTADLYGSNGKVRVSFYNPNSYRVLCTVHYAFSGESYAAYYDGGTSNSINGHFYGAPVAVYPGNADYLLTPPANKTFSVQWLRHRCKK